jgi:hypothetical protein
VRVKELIEKLQKYDPETMVVVNGYEGGYDEIEEVEEIKLQLNVNEAWYYGKHESAIDNEEFDCKAILIK